MDVSPIYLIIFSEELQVPSEDSKLLTIAIQHEKASRMIREA